MFKHKIILALSIFALVNSGAKIYGQSSKPDIYQVLLHEAIDSVLKEQKLSLENTLTFNDTGNGFTGPSRVNRDNEHVNIIWISHILRNQKVYNTSDNFEEGEYSVSAQYCITQRGINVNEIPSIPKLIFTKSRKFALNFIKDDEPRSFWDSTAKPILVTLGAIAIIALFFLVRG